MKRGMKGMIAAVVMSVITFIQSLFSGCGEIIAEPTSGGTSDNSDRNAAKTIVSEELTSFEYDFNYYGERYVPGHYLLSLRLENGTADYYIKIEAAVEAEMSGSADADTMVSLARLIKDEKTAGYNGWHKSNSALGEDMSFSAEYASGESISISARGGSSANPGFSPEPYIGFFDTLAAADGRGISDYSLTDESDPSAPKKVKSDTLTSLYCEFRNDTTRNAEGFKNGFVWGGWLINYSRQHRLYVGHDENCCIRTDFGDFFIELTDEAADELGKMLKDMGLEKLNGYDVKDETGSRGYRLHAGYEDEDISITAFGSRAVPEELDFVRILTFLRDYCREAGYDVPPLEGKG